MKKTLSMLMLAGGLVGISACNSETGTVHEGTEGYGTEQTEPGEGDAVMDPATEEGTGVIDTKEVLLDTTGTSATMKTKTGAGTSQSKGQTNTSKSETTKNVEVNKK